MNRTRSSSIFSSRHSNRQNRLAILPLQSLPRNTTFKSNNQLQKSKNTQSPDEPPTTGSSEPHALQLSSIEGLPTSEPFPKKTNNKKPVKTPRIQHLELQSNQSNKENKKRHGSFWEQRKLLPSQTATDKGMTLKTNTSKMKTANSVEVQRKTAEANRTLTHNGEESDETMDCVKSLDENVIPSIQAPVTKASNRPKPMQNLEL
ncbi:hypothetical protein M3Y94_00810500 [Aphelenchoides besseyi]|nr:hypothetical protein M3Y94_00810500 [Aphelenchoides besseyi]KAI6227210.1 hypothetical protein M3Y95_00702700 [Aphelenchoides besseyi]